MPLGKKPYILRAIIALIIFFSSQSVDSYLYTSDFDRYESDIQLDSSDVYSLGPYNITFNFSNMNNFQVDYLSAPVRMEDDYAEDRRIMYGWTDDLTQIKLATPDHSKMIYLYIIRFYFSPPPQTTNYDQCEEYNPNRIPQTFSSCSIKRDNYLIWTSYRTSSDLPDLDRPIPRYGNIHFEAIPENYSELRDAEIVQINFENIPEEIANQFVNSLNISGLGTKAIERVESWNDFVSRARKPNDYNGFDQGISALKFIDILYNKDIHYDPETGELYNIPNKKKVSLNDTEQFAIDLHYWGPIPLPKNICADFPNGQ